VCPDRQADERIIAQSCHGFQRHISCALPGPIIVLFQQQGTDQTGDGGIVGGEGMTAIGPKKCPNADRPGTSSAASCSRPWPPATVASGKGAVVQARAPRLKRAKTLDSDDETGEFFGNGRPLGKCLNQNGRNTL